MSSDALSNMGFWVPMIVKFAGTSIINIEVLLTV
jgi:hypothetical protein